MYRSMMQVFVKKSDEALEFYKKAFNAEEKCTHYNSDGTLAHSEIDIFGQIMAVSELPEEKISSGNTMMFCLHFGNGKEEIVKKIYGALKDKAEIESPLNSCEWSSLMFALIDKYGVRWCIFA